MKTIFDLTKLIDNNLSVYPGDPVFYQESINHINDVNPYELQYIHISNHTGTHIDYPAHVIKDGKNSLDFPVSHLTGDGYIIEYKSSSDIIKLFDNKDLKDKIIFFKNAMHLDKNIVNYLLEKQIKIIGIDGLSIDKIEDTKLSLHNELLKNDILIVENLYLDEISEGDYQIMIAPLKIISDGIPARVIAWN